MGRYWRAASLFLIVMVALAYACSASAFDPSNDPYVRVLHRIDANLVDGKAAYRLASGGGDFRWSRMFPQNLPRSVGTLQIHFGTPTRIAYDATERAKRRMDMRWWDTEFAVWVHPYDGEHRVGSDGGNVSVLDESGLSECDFTSVVGETSFRGVFPRIHTIADQWRDKCLPYVELDVRRGVVKKIKWRFVDPGDTATALTRNASGRDVLQIRNVSLVSKSAVRPEWSVTLNKRVGFGERLAGEVMIPGDVRVDDVLSVNVCFEYGDRYAENASISYMWVFVTKSTASRGM